MKINGLKNVNEELKILYGGVNIINSNINLNSLTVENINAEDSINFINSTVSGGNIFINNSKSDALDADFSNMYFDNLICQNIGNDCLDLSGSFVNIKGIYADTIKDKAISVGEKSFLNTDSVKIISSSIGVVAKDESLINIRKYKFQKTKVPIAAFVKKNEFGPPKIFVNKLLNRIINSNFISFDSFVKINNIKINGKDTSFNIYKKLYNSNFLK